MVDINVDTVDTILREVEENYMGLFDCKASTADVNMWGKILKNYFPKKVGRFLVLPWTKCADKKCGPDRV